MEQAEASRAMPRLGGRALLALFLCLLALPAWFVTLDVPWMRSSAAAAWFLLGVGAAIGLRAAWADRRAWVRLLAGLDLVLLVGFAWVFFVFARMPNADAAIALERAPDFELASTSDGTVCLSEELARGPVHLVFFRGPW